MTSDSPLLELTLDEVLALQRAAWGVPEPETREADTQPSPTPEITE